LILSKPNYIKIYGHRGARGVFPENTLDSFQYLFDNNISAYETDILISKDLVPVITHNFHLNPSLTKDSDGNWLEKEDIKIYDLTYENISRYEVGSINKLSKYGRRFINQKKLKNQKIPKLSQLLDLTSKNIIPNLLINLEIKSTPMVKNLTPEIEELVRIVIEEVHKSKLKDKIIYSSFDWNILKEIKNYNPDLPRAYLTEEQRNIYDQSPWMDFTPLHNNVDLPKLIKALGGVAWHPYYKDITKKMVESSHEENLPVNVWTVNKEEDMLRMIEYGVDGIMSDYPVKLKELCVREKINWF
tara:strand:+ start:3449 stop:4351 length:903 start_codon:yes stop_codon:yes gene_type:complete